MLKYYQDVFGHVERQHMEKLPPGITLEQQRLFLSKTKPVIEKYDPGNEACQPEEKKINHWQTENIKARINIYTHG